MKINITQQDLSIGDKYNIQVSGVQAYVATRLFLAFPVKIILSKEKGSESILVIRRRFIPFIANYIIRLNNDEIFKFR